MVGREEHLHRNAREVVGLRDVAVDAAGRSSRRELVELDLVLAADEGVVEDEDVVQVDVRVGDREVRRAREQRRVPGVVALPSK